MLGAERNHVRLVEALLAANANVCAVDENGNSALHLACFYGHREVVRLLLGTEDVNVAVRERERKRVWGGEGRRGERSCSTLACSGGGGNLWSSGLSGVPLRTLVRFYPIPGSMWLECFSTAVTVLQIGTKCFLHWISEFSPRK